MSAVAVVSPQPSDLTALCRAFEQAARRGRAAKHPVLYKIFNGISPDIEDAVYTSHAESVARAVTRAAQGDRIGAALILLQVRDGLDIDLYNAREKWCAAVLPGHKARIAEVAAFKRDIENYLKTKA